MKKILTLALPILLLTGCTLPEYPANSVQSTPEQSTEIVTENAEITSKKINYETQNGLWFPYTDFENYIQGKTEEEFKNAVREMFKNAKSDGVNTVYVHVRPMGDAYYKSKIFPKGLLLDGNYDPLEIMLREAHELGLSFHAWINPLRLQTAEEMERVSDEYITKQWVREPEKHFVENVNGRYYLNPAYTEVRQLIADGVSEIIKNYDVDGVHIDDYFYPTTDTSFDEEAFAESGSNDLQEWRTKNVTEYVKNIYDTVKNYDKNILFGISPQGNISADYNSQYADVGLWAGTDGYCDYIVPQIYFGFQNETCPFDNTLAEWEKLRGNSGVSLIIGLAEYKLGREDVWAGEAGEREWIENPDVIERQIELVELSSADGYARYK